MTIYLFKFFFSRAPLFALLALLFFYSAPVLPTQAQEQDSKCIGRLVSLQGHIRLKKANQTLWQRARLGQCVEIGTIISAGTNSRAAVILNSGSLVRLDENSSLVITKELEEGFLIRMIEGIIHFFSVHPKSMEVVTPFLNAAIEGTEFIFEQTPRKTTVIVLSGKVIAQNPGGRALLGPGEGAIATRLKPPAIYQVSNLMHYVQWALYYPAILDQASIIKKYQITGLNNPLELYKKGRIAEAIQAFHVIEKRRGLSPVERALFASLLLAVGQVEKANQQIEKALGANSRLAPALALKAIIALCLHDTKKATFFSKKALEAGPDSAAALIASSYVLQSEARLEDAISVAKKATRLEPENGIARIKLSELLLCLGELDRARKEAARALALNPNLSRARTLFGFIKLLNMERKEATRHFNQAIELDPADPLPRLGLGLSFIKGGRLKEGLRQLQIATGLNPGNSLIRSYLGKAYFSINRPAKALEELDLAQRLDPNDPTPSFYEAICLVNMNQPGKALRSLTRSIKLNANRAIYRSRLLLGQDLGIRGSALARIYGELGFEQLALLQGWKSLDYDPASYAAHRFLADTYSALPRHEIARVSELLKSQLLQPLNITPVQPHLAESKHFFHVDTGPFSPGYNEYTPLFMWNRTAFMASGLVGTRDSVGDEVTLAALGDRYSVSLGQFHYETDGFRPNNQQYHDIYNVFTQTALSHDLSLQAEYRYSRITSGDLFLRFDPDNYIPDLDQKRRRHDLRLGARYSQSPSSTFISSLILARTHWDSSLLDGNSLEDKERGIQAELQHIFEGEFLNMVSGLGWFEARQKLKNRFGSFGEYTEKDTIRHINFYVYPRIRPWKRWIFTIGASLDVFNGPIEDRTQFNPKFGILWTPFPGTTIRAAVFRELRRMLLTDQTLEPTQVAGFNQFYDDCEGSRAWNYGVALDQEILKGRLFGGVTLKWRRLRVPYLSISFNKRAIAHWDEDLARCYLYWLVTDNLALSTSYTFEEFERPAYHPGEEDIVDLRTHRWPIAVNFFGPAGFRFGAKATGVWQEGVLGNIMTGTRYEKDNFWVLDAHVGYQLPAQRGMLELKAKNLFDSRFKFQDTDPANPTICPRRLIFARITLWF